MRKILAEIRNGTFAKAWIEENEKGCPNFLATRQREQQHSSSNSARTSRHDAIPAAVIAPGLENKAARVEKITFEWSTGASFIYRTVPWLTLGWNWAILSRDETQRGLDSGNHAAPR